MGAGFIAAGVLAGQAWLLSLVVGRVFLGGEGLRAVAPLIGWMAALWLVRAVCLGLKDWLAQRAANQVKLNLRQALVAQLVRLGPAYTQNERSGELASSLVEGVEKLDDYITQYLPARFLAFLATGFIFLAVLLIDPWTTLIFLVAGPFLVLLLALIGGQAKAITERRFLELSWMSAFFLDILQGLATLKMFGRSREQAENIREISSHYGSTTMEVLRTAFQTSLVMEWAATAATALAALEISLRIMNDSLAFERGLAALLLTPEFFLPLRQMALKYHSGTGGRAAADRLFAILEHPSTSPGTPGTPRMPATDPGKPGTLRMPGIHFENVSFAYADGQRPALDGFSLEIPAGGSVALVGATGAGKSTAASLLLRFIEPSDGQIWIDGQPLERMERAAWLEQVGWVSQRPYLFQGTVAENLRLARPGASQPELEAAAQAANAAEFIERLPQGYATRLGEQGVRLSGGQRQRIAIARAFLKDAPFLILDEATAYLDRENETLIHEALQRLMRQRTVLIIAHRLKLAYQADQIALVEAGRVVETGKHVDLLERSRRYQQLAAAYERGAW